MSRKALLVGLEYPSEPDNKLPSSVNSILEFNSCLIEHMDVPATNIDMLFDTPATGQGDISFNAKEVIYKFFQFVSDAKEGDVLVFAFAGHGTYGGPNGAAIYLGLDGEGKGVYMDAKVFKTVLDQLNKKKNPNKLYMFISASGSGGLLVDFGFNNQLRDVETPIVDYPSVIAFMSSIREGISSSKFNDRWQCECSTFMYAVIRAIETEKNVPNLVLGQWIDLLLQEIESEDAEIRLAMVDLVDDEGERKQKLDEAVNRNRCVQRATLSCTDNESRAQFLC